MERLTELDEYGNADIVALSDVMPELYAGLSFSETRALTDALNRLAAYEDTGLEPGEVKDFYSRFCEARDIAVALGQEYADHVDELLEAEKQGRLIVLPCRVGDKVYIVKDCFVCPEKVRTFFLGHPSYRTEQRNAKMIRTQTCDIPFSEIGKRVFLTREEAEAALERRLAEA